MRVYMQTGASSQEWSAEQLNVVAGIMGQLVKSNQKHLPSLWP
jgi:hypothetical protein